MLRATPIDIDIVSGLKWDEADDSGHVHVILSQRVPTTGRAVVITCRGDSATRMLSR